MKLQSEAEILKERSILVYGNRWNPVGPWWLKQNLILY